MFAAMDEHALDLLVLGRVANIRYASGAPVLWNAGTRPFGPGCVAVRATREVFLLSTWDEAVPDDIDHDHLYGITWNPMNFVEILKGIGAPTGRVGTDAMSPLFANLLPMAFPHAAIVDAGPALSAARRVKTTEEVDAICAAIGVAESAMATTIAELRPGVSERDLTAIFMEAMASLGVTTPATQDVARITSACAAGLADKQGLVRPRDLVSFRAAVVAGGYVGEVGRTWPVGMDQDDSARSDLFARCDELLARLLDACRPGARASGLIEAYRSAGEPIPTLPIAHGLGLGFDDPVVTRSLPRTAHDAMLDPGVVLVVTSCVFDDAVGSVIAHEPVLITEDGHEVLSHSPFWNPEHAGAHP